jgi:RNA polymerase sigma-70 factor (ECF subfamily)
MATNSKNNSVTQSNNTLGDTMNNDIFALYNDINTTLSIKTGDRQLAHDLTMDALSKAIDRQGSFDPDKAQLKTWVSFIAHNVMLDYFRSHAVSRTSGGMDAATMDILMGGYESEPTDIVDTDSFWDTVKTLVNDKEYGCLERRFNQDMSYADIALDMGIPKGSVMSALSNGKRKLSTSPTFLEFKALMK